ELKPLVAVWRQSNSKILKIWRDVDRAAKETVRQGKAHMTHGIKFEYHSGILLIVLPFCRWFSYVKLRIWINRLGNESASYEGMGATKKWERIFSYGSKFVENIV